MTYSFEEWRENLDAVAADLVELLASKQRDYGPLNIANAPGGPINGLRVRMYDKLARISNLHESGVDPEHESLIDSFMDLANYGIIGVMILRGMWPFTEQYDRAKTEDNKAEDVSARYFLDENAPPSRLKEHLLGVSTDLGPVTYNSSCGVKSCGLCYDRRYWENQEFH